MQCPWGEKAFTGYLGADKAAWATYDATELVKQYEGPDLHLLVDQGDADNFYTQGFACASPCLSTIVGRRSL
jgi:S-formylglutathione hydrolase|eukprot:SAG25_NODE_513_length_7280_cov_53.762707_2_plen_72_part_00